MYKDQLVKKNEDEKHIFKVKVKIHGKNMHTEYYSIKSEHLELAKDMDLFIENDSGYVKYFDWKPIITKDNLEGGIKIVEDKFEDHKYFYVVTEDNIYSLPKYLRKDLPAENLILFGKREK